MLGLQQTIEQLMAVDFTPFVLAVVVGGMIGLERELHGRPAGLRARETITPGFQVGAIV